MATRSYLSHERVPVPGKPASNRGLAPVIPPLLRSEMLRFGPGLAPVWSQAALCARVRDSETTVHSRCQRKVCWARPLVRRSLFALTVNL